MPKLLISDFQEGFENDKEPFLLPEKAFSILEDAYVSRGRLRKRFGFNLLGNSPLLSRLRINVGTTAAITGDLGATTMPGNIFKIGQTFSVGTTVFTVTALGNPAVLLSTGAATATFDTTTGQLIITGNNENPSTAVFFYPSEPVMGLRTRETTDVNFEQTVAFDTQFAYVNTGTGWNLLGPIPPAAGSALWSGNNFNFFWTTNYRAANAFDNNFYVVNGVAADNIKYIQAGGAAWTNLQPTLNTAGDTLDSCRILLPFKDRLVALNTIENDGASRSYRNRARWSQNGDPTVAATSWLDDVVGRGGYVDAPTSEAIISAQFVKDRLIVFFERSTWELVYTSNEVLPFVWKQINTELGCESTFSEVSFDEGVIGVGNRGIHIANSAGIQRIDSKIPNIINNFNNLNQGNERVYGIRDFAKELVMWTFPYSDDNQVFPNRVLVYNYINGTFAVFNDSFTCYGYFQKITGDTWDTLPYDSWDEWIEPWDSAILKARTPLIAAGNQQGWTFLFDDASQNDDSLVITNMVGTTITSIDHNLSVGQYITLTSVNGMTITGGPVFRINNVTTNTLTIDATSAIGTYTGGGYIRVLNNFLIRTKNFTPFDALGKKTDLTDMDFLITKTDNGEFTLNLYQDFNFTQPIEPLVGSSVVRTRPEDGDIFSQNQDKIWHEVKRGLLADSFLLELTMSDAQMRTLDINTAPFEMHAISLNVEPTGRLK